MIKVIRARAKDFGKFYTLLEKSIKEEYFLYPKENASYLLNIGLPKKMQLKKEVLNGERPLYLVYEERKLIGYLLTKKDFAGVAFGHWLAVHKDFRNKGFASKMLKVWEQDALKQGVHAIHLWTTENDIGFYKKRGFILGGKFEQAWFGLNHYLFYKIIGNPNPKKYI